LLHLHNAEAAVAIWQTFGVPTLQEYLVFFPLTRNTNKANIAAGERHLQLEFMQAGSIQDPRLPRPSLPGCCNCCLECSLALLHSKCELRCAAVAALGARALGDVTSPNYAAEPFDCKYAPATALDAAGTAGTGSGTQR
jgi:hypothetical protein